MLSRSTCPCFSPPCFLLNSYMLSAQLVGQLLPFPVSVLPCSAQLSWCVNFYPYLFQFYPCTLSAQLVFQLILSLFQLFQLYPGPLSSQLVCQLLPFLVPVLPWHVVCLLSWSVNFYLFFFQFYPGMLSAQLVGRLLPEIETSQNIRNLLRWIWWCFVHNVHICICVQ